MLATKMKLYHAELEIYGIGEKVLSLTVKCGSLKTAIKTSFVYLPFH